jgi:hypothetical protein
MMPIPDVATDGNYDGISEAGCFDSSKPNGTPLVTATPDARCLGRLPWKTLGAEFGSMAENDPIGVVPWYAVSANLALANCVEALNSEMLNYTVQFACPPVGKLPYAWLTVRDAQGRVLSDRVAFVLMMPGPPIGAQTRPVAPGLAGPTAYLDTIAVTGVSAGCPSGNCTFSNADLDNDLVVGDASATFNDAVIYVTIDELMERMERRVAQEVRASIERFRTATGTFSWLGSFDPTSAQTAVARAGTTGGSLPFHTLYGKFISDFGWSLSGGTVSTLGTVTSADMRNPGAIVVQGATCEWTAIGARAARCKGTIANPLPGVANRQVEVDFPFSATTSSTVSYQSADSANVTTRTVTKSGSLSFCGGGCLVLTDTDLSGATTGTGKISGGTGTLTVSKVRYYPELPDWFAANRWHQLVRVVIAPGAAPPNTGTGCGTNCLSIFEDNRSVSSDARFVVLLAGRALNGLAQTRPSLDLTNYFDGPRNSDPAGIAFDRYSVASPAFNDQIVWQ